MKKFRNFEFQQSVFGFSMIELSICFIIIGFLITGIVGSKTLLENAKIRAFINELNDYKQAVAIFYSTKKRYPGDFNNDGYFGRCDAGSGCKSDVYTASSFKSPYNISNINKEIGGFIELYLMGLINAKPKIVGNTVQSPHSKIYKKGVFKFYSYGNTDSASSSSFYYKMKNASPYLNFYNSSADYRQTEIFKLVDEKIDDGEYNAGDVRAYSISPHKTYEEAIKAKKRLTDLYYNVGVR